MDSFELNKVMGAVLGTCLFVLSLSIVSGGIFASHPPQKAGYEIAVKDDKAGPTQGPTEPQVPLANLLNEAKAEKGASVSRQCVACHEFAKGGPNKVGPGLWNVVNADIATHAGFAYSNAMKNKKGKWTFEELDKFLENPSKHVPGTSMTFLGVRRAADRAALIVYLSQQADSPVALPPPVALAPDAQKKDGEKKDAPAQKDQKKGAETKDAAPPAAEQKAAPAQKQDAPAPAQPQNPKPDGTGQTK